MRNGPFACVLFMALWGVLCFPLGRLIKLFRLDWDRAPFAQWRWERDGQVYERAGIRMLVDEGLTLERGGARLDILPEAGGLSGARISDRFDVALNEGEPEAYHVTMPPQFHMSWVTEKRRVHDIRVRLRVTRPERG